MNPCTRVFNKCRQAAWDKNRKIVNNRNRKQLTNANFSVISQNCNGSILSHDLGLRFCSPTVNMFFNCEDMVKFCENMQYYLNLEPKESEHDLTWHLAEKYVDGSNTTGTYPVMLLGDLTLFMVHYKSFEEAKVKWEDRKARVNYDNLCILAVDRDGYTPELKKRFAALPYHKVMFVHKPEDVNGCFYYIKGFENTQSVGVLTDSHGWKGLRYLDQFDYISFFNEAEKK